MGTKQKSTNQGNSQKKRRTSTVAEQAKTLATSQQTTSPARLKLVPPANIFNQMQQLYDSIARRAFELFENNGRVFGRDLDDWFKAESELLHPVHIDVAESDGDLTVRAEVPGFTAEELEVSVEPQRLAITGKRETKEERKDKKTLYTERCSDRVMRVVDLPVAVDPDKAAATLKDGVLELTIPKAAPARKIQIESKKA
jgi:HSP20 family protein